MLKSAWVLSAALLALGIGWLAIARARDEDAEEKAKIQAAKKAAPDVNQLADNVDNPVELKKLADAVAKKYDELLPIMWQMKPRRNGGGGLGVGPTPGAYVNDCIELQLLELGGKKAPIAKDIKDHAADWQAHGRGGQGHLRRDAGLREEFRKEAGGGEGVERPVRRHGQGRR